MSTRSASSSPALTPPPHLRTSVETELKGGDPSSSTFTAATLTPTAAPGVVAGMSAGLPLASTSRFISSPPPPSRSVNPAHRLRVTHDDDDSLAQRSSSPVSISSEPDTEVDPDDLAHFVSYEMTNNTTALSSSTAPSASASTSTSNSTSTSTSTATPVVLGNVNGYISSTAREREREHNNDKEPTPVLDLTDTQDDDNDDDSSSPFVVLDSRTFHRRARSESPLIIFPVPSDSKGKQRALTSPDPELKDRERSPPDSIATLACPICFGPPVPIAMTQCGHVFCAPCLHAALVAGPALTPPPPNVRGGGARGAGLGARARGALFRTAPRGRGRGGRRVQDVMYYPQEDDDNEALELEPEGELDKHCPVCRKPLRGGWGKSLRGVILRMEPKKRKAEGSSVQANTNGVGSHAEVDPERSASRKEVGGGQQRGESP